jgi:hypothetical protein
MCQVDEYCSRRNCSRQIFQLTNNPVNKYSSWRIFQLMNIPVSKYSSWWIFQSTNVRVDEFLGWQIFQPTNVGVDEFLLYLAQTALILPMGFSALSAYPMQQWKWKNMAAVCFGFKGDSLTQKSFLFSNFRDHCDQTRVARFFLVQQTKKYIKWSQNMPNGRKIDQMDIQYNNIL